MSRPATAAQGLAPTTDRTTRAPKAPDTPLAPATTAPGARADRIGDAVTGPTAAPLPGGSPTSKRPVTPGYLQAKLAVSRPQDAEEREADRVAGEVSRALRTPTRAASAPDAPVRRGEAPRGSLEPAITPPRQPTLAPKLMRQPRTGSPAGPGLASTTQDADAGTGAADVHQAPAATEQRIAARRGQGAPLEPRLRAQLGLVVIAAHAQLLADALGRGQQGSVVGGVERLERLLVQAPGVEADQQQHRHQDADQQLPAQRPCGAKRRARAGHGAQSSALSR